MSNCGGLTTLLLRRATVQDLFNPIVNQVTTTTTVSHAIDSQHVVARSSLQQCHCISLRNSQQRRSMHQSSTTSNTASTSNVRPTQAQQQRLVEPTLVSGLTPLIEDHHDIFAQMDPAIKQRRLLEDHLQQRQRQQQRFEHQQHSRAQLQQQQQSSPNQASVSASAASSRSSTGNSKPISSMTPTTGSIITPFGRMSIDAAQQAASARLSAAAQAQQQLYQDLKRFNRVTPSQQMIEQHLQLIESLCATEFAKSDPSLQHEASNAYRKLFIQLVSATLRLTLGIEPPELLTQRPDESPEDASLRSTELAIVQQYHAPICARITSERTINDCCKIFKSWAAHCHARYIDLFSMQTMLAVLAGSRSERSLMVQIGVLQSRTCRHLWRVSNETLLWLARAAATFQFEKETKEVLDLILEFTCHRPQTIGELHAWRAQQHARLISTSAQGPDAKPVEEECLLPMEPLLPTVHHFNCLLRIFARAGDAVGALACFNLHSQISKNRSWHINERSYALVCTALLSRGMLNSALDQLNSMPKSVLGRPPSIQLIEHLLIVSCTPRILTLAPQAAASAMGMGPRDAQGRYTTEAQRMSAALVVRQEALNKSRSLDADALELLLWAKNAYKHTNGEYMKQRRLVFEAHQTASVKQKRLDDFRAARARAQKSFYASASEDDHLDDKTLMKLERDVEKANLSIEQKRAARQCALEQRFPSPTSECYAILMATAMHEAYNSPNERCSVATPSQNSLTQNINHNNNNMTIGTSKQQYEEWQRAEDDKFQYAMGQKSIEPQSQRLQRVLTLYEACLSDGLELSEVRFDQLIDYVAKTRANAPGEALGLVVERAQRALHSAQEHEDYARALAEWELARTTADDARTQDAIIDAEVQHQNRDKQQQSEANLNQNETSSQAALNTGQNGEIRSESASSIDDSIDNPTDRIVSQTPDALSSLVASDRAHQEVAEAEVEAELNTKANSEEDQQTATEKANEIAIPNAQVEQVTTRPETEISNVTTHDTAAATAAESSTTTTSTSTSTTTEAFQPQTRHNSNLESERTLRMTRLRESKPKEPEFQLTTAPSEYAFNTVLSLICDQYRILMTPMIALQSQIDALHPKVVEQQEQRELVMQQQQQQQKDQETTAAATTATASSTAEQKDDTKSNDATSSEREPSPIERELFALQQKKALLQQRASEAHTLIEQLLELMTRCGRRPAMSSYSLLLDAYLQTQQYEQAQTLYDFVLRELEFVTNERASSAMLGCMFMHSLALLSDSGMQLYSRLLNDMIVAQLWPTHALLTSAFCALRFDDKSGRMTCLALDAVLQLYTTPKFLLRLAELNPTQRQSFLNQSLSNLYAQLRRLVVRGVDVCHYVERIRVTVDVHRSSSASSLSNNNNNAPPVAAGSLVKPSQFHLSELILAVAQQPPQQMNCNDFDLVMKYLQLFLTHNSEVWSIDWLLKFMHALCVRIERQRRHSTSSSARSVVATENDAQSIALQDSRVLYHQTLRLCREYCEQLKPSPGHAAPVLESLTALEHVAIRDAKFASAAMAVKQYMHDRARIVSSSQSGPAIKPATTKSASVPQQSVAPRASQPSQQHASSVGSRSVASAVAPAAARNVSAQKPAPAAQSSGAVSPSHNARAATATATASSAQPRAEAAPQQSASVAPASDLAQAQTQAKESTKQPAESQIKTSKQQESATRPTQTESLKVSPPAESPAAHLASDHQHKIEEREEKENHLCSSQETAAAPASAPTDAEADVHQSTPAAAPEAAPAQTQAEETHKQPADDQPQRDSQPHASQVESSKVESASGDSRQAPAATDQKQQQPVEEDNENQPRSAQESSDAAPIIPSIFKKIKSLFK